MANSHATLIEQHTIELGRVDGHDVSMTFHRISACPEGFSMGSRGVVTNEEPIHRVVIPNDFWLAKTPVTQAQFAVWTETEGIKHKNHFAGNRTHPAESLTWNQACDYCDWLITTYGDRFPPDHRIASLPSEAHWEYACRGATTTEYHSGDGETALREAGWFGEKWGEGSTHPVALLRPNDFGLHDMHGNVWEWCLDRWDANAYRRRFDGIDSADAFALNEQHGDTSDNPDRVLRGGSWGGSACSCRSAYRSGFGAGISGWSFGFRVCLVRSPIGTDKSGPASREQ